MNRNGKKVIECAGIALVNRGRVFLIRPLFNGVVQQLGIPKGHVERGERLQDAAIREFAEETGIDLSGRPMEAVGHVYAKINDDEVKKVTVFRVVGDGTEEYIGSNVADNGEPENIIGGYVDMKLAIEMINPYQQPIIKKLIDDSMSGFKSFFAKNFME